MASSGSCALGLHIVVCLLTATFGTFYPETVYLSDKCNHTYSVWGDVRIKLASTFLLPSNNTCNLKLESSTDTKLIVKFRSYYMNPSYTNVQGNCEYESIELTNVQGIPLLPGNEGYCDIPKPDSLYDLGYSGYFSYSTYQQEQILTADVEILVTAITVKQGSDCPSGYFDCYYNNYCINNAITCNGYNDCGNNRDETVGCSISGGAIAAIVVCLCFAFGCIAVIVFCVFKRRMRQQYVRF